MSRYYFDSETNGLLESLTKIHSLVLRDLDTNVVFSCHDNAEHGNPRAKEGVLVHMSIAQGLELLAAADEVVGQNIIKYDIPAITKVYPNWRLPAHCKIVDTLVMSRVIWPALRDDDINNRRRRPNFPGNMYGRHSLEAWGLRLGFPKDDYKARCKELGIDPWAEWNPMMQAYCEQDVAVTARFHEVCLSKNYDPRALDLEHRFQHVILKMENAGFPFDVAAGERLYNVLASRRDEIEKELLVAFAPWWTALELVSPKKTLNYKDVTRASTVEGCNYTRVTLTQFNVNSRDHVSNRLIALHGWEPEEFTKDGKPTIDDEILSELEYPEAKLLAEAFMLQKRIGQLAEGNGAWLKLVRGGRIHGEVNTNGAVTGRCTHSKPNIGQVPAVGKPYGAECRALFTAIKGFRLVGADAAGLELRMLAHYMARYDDGAYRDALLHGDIHWVNAIALGLVPAGTVFDDHNEHHLRARNNIAKRFIYAYLYGAGDAKIGSIVGGGAAAGKKLKAKFLATLPALKYLKDAIDKAVDARGYLTGLDGRRIPVRSKHAALNALLQGAGAVVVKLATVLFDDALAAAGLLWTRDFAMVAHVHDEFQTLARDEIAETVGAIAVKSFQLAGEVLALRCPIDGAYKCGDNWEQTH
ncbi:MAG: DNA polymerase [Parvibaculum sp.]|uniref:DNA polymerase n=1 Tax=Parvibaculum sp. TaxID=2024848 RepID=UPI002720921A|nr:DNA polymerase [Parvibaculum sp.]MDO8839661.1 DNA polymerase [Parvibaculum sp.]